MVVPYKATTESNDPGCKNNTPCTVPKPPITCRLQSSDNLPLSGLARLTSEPLSAPFLNRLGASLPDPTTGWEQSWKKHSQAPRFHLLPHPSRLSTINRGPSRHRPSCVRERTLNRNPDCICILSLFALPMEKNYRWKRFQNHRRGSPAAAEADGVLWFFSNTRNR